MEEACKKWLEDRRGKSRFSGRRGRRFSTLFRRFCIQGETWKIPDREKRAIQKEHGERGKKKRGREKEREKKKNSPWMHCTSVIMQQLCLIVFSPVRTREKNTGLCYFRRCVGDGSFEWKDQSEGRREHGSCELLAPLRKSLIES